MARLLYIAPISVCGDPVAGGHQRTRLIFDALASRHNVDVMIVGTGVADIHKRGFERAGAIYEVLHSAPRDEPPLSPLLFLFPPKLANKAAAALAPRRTSYAPDARIRESLRRFDFSVYDLIVSRFFRPAARVGVFQPEIAAPVVIDVDDRDDLVFASRLKRNSANPILAALNRWHAGQTRAIMSEKLPAASHLWVVGEEDRAALAHRSMSLLANIAWGDPPTNVEPPPPSGDVLFVGSVEHEPNRQGVLRFLKKCWPAISAECPAARFRIVGRGWERLPASLVGQEGVELAGFVPDLAAEYRRAGFVVSPVYEGAGTKIKVVEALAHGRAVIADGHSARGFPAAMQEDGIVTVDSDAAMIGACVRLLTEPERATRLGLAGRAHVLASFTRARFEEIVLSDCDRVLHEAAARRTA